MFEPDQPPRRMSTGNFLAVAAAILLTLVGGCAVVISGASGGIPEAAYVGVPLLVAGVAIFWRVVKRYPKAPPRD
jgi:hypothetical protein